MQWDATGLKIWVYVNGEISALRNELHSRLRNETNQFQNFELLDKVKSIVTRALENG